MLLSLIILLTTCLYIQCEVYNFQDSIPFHGNKLYNPYSCDTPSQQWHKANFHAHSIAWKHLTNGHQTPAQVCSVYQRLGYSVACISNYHRIARSKHKTIHSLPIYEHGYNIFKTHQLVFEPTRVNFFDLPFVQTTSVKQSVLNSLSDESACIALNHPTIRDGYTDEQLKILSGYNLLEVLNHSAIASGKWDIILSAGKPVWCIGNDDMHNATKNTEVGVCWTMLVDTKNITDELKKGNAYSVYGQRGIAENELNYLQVNGDTINICLKQPANTITFIGQNGVVKKMEYNTAFASYIFKSDDTYVRTEVNNGHSKLYLNPVIRYTGKDTPQNYCTATINIFKTILYRFLVLICCVSLLLLLHQQSVKRLMQIIMGLLKKGHPDHQFVSE